MEKYIAINRLPDGNVQIEKIDADFRTLHSRGYRPTGIQCDPGNATEVLIRDSRSAQNS